MAALISFFVVLIVSLIIVRIATVMLKLTGLSSESAKFQARSAFTGTGFTTQESESVVNHPVRRRIIMVLMLVRNAGFITVLSSLILSFVNTRSSEEVIRRGLLLGGGMLVLVLFFRSKLLDRILSNMIKWALTRWTKMRVSDYDSLLNLSAEYEVIESTVTEADWVVGKPLRELQLPDEGVLVLGIRKNSGEYIGTPTGESVIRSGDRVVLYGRERILQLVESRPAGPEGDLQHEEAVMRYKGIYPAETRRTPFRSGVARRLGRFFFRG